MRDAGSRFAISSRGMGIRRSGILAVFLAAALGLTAGQAAAATTHVAGPSFSTGEVGLPASIAVDEQNGFVYTMDLFSGKIGKFTTAGVPSEFSALGTNVLIPGCGGECNQIAVDNSGGPNDGTIYVSDEIEGDTPNRKVFAFLPSGKETDGLHGQVQPYPESQYCGVATDVNGRVYVGHNNGLEPAHFIPFPNSSAYVQRVQARHLAAQGSGGIETGMAGHRNHVRDAAVPAQRGPRPRLPDRRRGDRRPVLRRVRKGVRRQAREVRGVQGPKGVLRLPPGPAADPSRPRQHELRRRPGDRRHLLRPRKRNRQAHPVRRKAGEPRAARILARGGGGRRHRDRVRGEDRLWRNPGLRSQDDPRCRLRHATAKLSVGDARGNNRAGRRRRSHRLQVRIRDRRRLRLGQTVRPRRGDDALQRGKHPRVGEPHGPGERDHLPLPNRRDELERLDQWARQDLRDPQRPRPEHRPGDRHLTWRRDPERLVHGRRQPDQLLLRMGHEHSLRQ